MSKRKHRSREDTKRQVTAENKNNKNINSTMNNMNSRQTYNNGLFGINPNQLLSTMFGNIDMNQINSLLQSMNTQGFDFNNLNLGNLMGNMNSLGGNANQNINNSNINNDTNINEDESSKVRNNKSNRNDDNMQMLIAIRNIVSGERGIFIDKIISMYNDGAFD